MVLNCCQMRSKVETSLGAFCAGAGGAAPACARARDGQTTRLSTTQTERMVDFVTRVSYAATVTPLLLDRYARVKCLLEGRTSTRPARHVTGPSIQTGREREMSKIEARARPHSSRR